MALRGHVTASPRNAALFRPERPGNGVASATLSTIAAYRLANPRPRLCEEAPQTRLEPRFAAIGAASFDPCALLARARCRPQSLFHFSSSGPSSSNLDPHPVPVDYSVFEDPHEKSEYTATTSHNALAEVSHTYEVPSPASVLEKMLGGSDRGIPADNLNAAYAALQQLKKLHADLGPPLPCYALAAYVADKLDRPAPQFFQWLEMIPDWQSDLAGKEQIAPRLVGILFSFRHRVARRPLELRKVLEILFAKKWHSEEWIARHLFNSARDLLRARHVRISVLDHWRFLSAIRQGEAESAQAAWQQRFAWSKIYNTAVRELALAGYLQEASDIVLASSPLPAPGTPVLTALTYRTLLEELLYTRTDENADLAHRIHIHLQSMLSQLRAAPRANPVEQDAMQYDSRANRAHLLVWSVRHIEILLNHGGNVFYDIMSGISEPTAKHKIHASEEDIHALIRASDVRGARQTLLGVINAYRLASPDMQRSGFHALPSAKVLAAYQERLISLQPPHSMPNEALRIPIDGRLEPALDASRGGAGLWETAFLLLLVDQRRFVEALQFFVRTFHGNSLHGVMEQVLGAGFIESVSPAVPSGRDVVQLGDAPGLTRPDPLLWPSSYVTNLVGRCLVQHILDGIPVEQGRPVEGKQRAFEERIERLDRAFQTWKKGLHEMREAGTLDSEQIDSYAFDPWLVGLAIQSTKLMTIVGYEFDRRHEVSELIGRLELFHGLDPSRLRESAMSVGEDTAARGVEASLNAQGISNDQEQRGETPHPWLEGQHTRASETTYRVLSILADMQDLGVRPSIATYCIVLDSLARDAPHTWPLIVHIAEQLGIAPSQTNGAGLAQVPSEAGTATAEAVAPPQTYMSGYLHTHMHTHTQQRAVAQSSSSASASASATSREDSSFPLHSPYTQEDLLITLTALFRGLLYVPTRVAGSMAGLRYAQEVRRWMSLLVDWEQQPAQGGDSGGSPPSSGEAPSSEEEKHDSAVAPASTSTTRPAVAPAVAAAPRRPGLGVRLSEADIRNDVRLMATLNALMDAEAQWGEEQRQARVGRGGGTEEVARA